jgi:hypothetical protein
MLQFPAGKTVGIEPGNIRLADDFGGGSGARDTPGKGARMDTALAPCGDGTPVSGTCFSSW